MSNEERDRRIYVLAGNNRQFLEYCHAARLVPGHQAVYLSDVMVLRGRRGPIELVKYGNWYERADASEITTMVDHFNHLSGTDTKILGEIREGMRVQANGREFVVDDVREDVAGNLQITLVLPGGSYQTEKAVRLAREIPVRRQGDGEPVSAEEAYRDVHRRAPGEGRRGGETTIPDGVATEE